MPYSGPVINVADSDPIVSKSELAADLRLNLRAANGDHLDRLIADAQAFVEQASGRLLIRRNVEEVIQINAYLSMLKLHYRDVISVQSLTWEGPNETSPESISTDEFKVTSGGRIWRLNSDTYWPWQEYYQNYVGEFYAKATYTSGIAVTKEELADHAEGKLLRRDVIALASAMHDEPRMSMENLAQAIGITARSAGGEFLI